MEAKCKGYRHLFCYCILNDDTLHKKYDLHSLQNDSKTRI